ncbi:MAG TPA: gamma-glutamyltransferase [Acetobacteraceae bacterium]|nr:gamma-glutamyltransferase [Acetobacteraceae bacterium]
MVVARHPLAAEAGRQILQDGGNAVDAAVAASLVGSVVQPVANTIGGGGLLLLSDPVCGRHAINYLYQAPQGATAEMFPLGPNAAPGLFGWSGVRDQLNEIGGRAVGVPGSIAGLHAASKRFGRLRWARVVAPAIAYASNGYAVDWYGALMLAVSAEDMQRYPITAQMFLRHGRYAYRPAVLGPADIHRQASLGLALEDVAADGHAAFYDGAIATDVAATVQRADGVLTLGDLQAYAVRTYEAATFRYRGVDVLYVPYGFPTLAVFFHILSAFEMGDLAPSDPGRLHLIIEALRRCWHFRDAYNGDSDQIEGPWNGLASAAFGQALSRTIRPDRASVLEAVIDPYDYSDDDRGLPSAGQPGGHEGTTHVSAADKDGGVVALTETIVGNFGSLVTTPSGILLNNGMIAFTPVAGQRNSVAPGRRPTTNMSPVIVLNGDGIPILTLGASGGRKILPAAAQILSLVIDCGIPLQRAISHPRLDIEGGTTIIDSRFPATVPARLQELGHNVEMRDEGLSTFEYGNPCGIQRHDGRFRSGVNPFQMTAASGY